MELLNWQKEVLDQNDLDVFEIITVRNAGKTTLGLAWLSKDADLSIFITKNAKTIRKELKEKAEEFKFKISNFYVVSNLDQLRKLNLSPKKRIKVFVDEYFLQPEVTLQALDAAIGHDKYKVLFIGSRSSKEDKFKLPFSKQYVVDLVKLFSDGAINRNQIDMVLESYNLEQLDLDFGTPFETN